MEEARSNCSSNKEDCITKCINTSARTGVENGRKESPDADGVKRRETAANGDLPHQQHSEKGETKGAFRGRRYGKECERETLAPNIPPELIPSNAVDITIKKSGKLWKVLLDPGEENVTLLPRTGNRAWIHYKCWFADDPEQKVFDSSSLCSEDVEPVCLNIGSKQVIRAIDVGIRSMTKRKEKALFIAHYDYAYGRRSSYQADYSNIPNGSFICAEVTLVDIEDVGILANCFGEGITREIVSLCGADDEDLNNAHLPLTTNSLMFIKLVGFKVEVKEPQQQIVFLPETVLPFTPCFHTWGYYASGNVEYPVPQCLGTQLRALRTGDKILFTFSGDSALTEDIHYNGVLIKAGEPVKYLVTVEEVEEINDPFMLSFKEKVEYCKKLVDRGILYNNHGWYEAAACKFTRVREYLWEAKRYLKVVPRQLGAQCDDLLYFALCKLASQFWNMPEMVDKEAVKHCSDAIEVLETMEWMTETLEYGDIMAAYQLRARLYTENLKEYGLAKGDLIKIVEMADKIISKLHQFVTQKMMEMKVADGDGEISNMRGITESDETTLKNVMDIKTMTLAQLKKTEELEKKQTKTFVFKYVPPK